MIARAARWVLVAAGIDRLSASAITSDLGRHRLRLALVIAASLAAPVAEVAFIGLLYAMVDAAQLQRVAERLDGLGWTSAVTAVGGPLAVAAAGAAACLIVAVAAKYVSGLEHARFLLSSFITQSRRIVEAYLFTPPDRGRTIDRAAIGSLAITEASQHGRVVYALLDTAANGAAVVLFIAAAIATSPWLLLMAAVVGATTLSVTGRGFRRQRAAGQQTVETNAALMGGLWEILNGYRTVKVEGGERQLLARLATDLRTKQTWRMEKARGELFIKLGTETTLYAALLGITVASVVALRVPASLVLVFLVLMGRLQKYLSAVQQAWIQVQYALPSLRAMSDAIEMCRAGTVDPPKAPVSADGLPQRLDVVFDGVRFSYGAGSDIVRDLSMTIAAGERVLVQGPSGEGKSTLLYLAGGLVTPTSGRVLWNGEPVTAERFYALRRLVTYVAPNTYLFRGSIRDNLCLGIEFGDAEVASAVEQAKLRPLVERLPGGLDADIGENGINLSLGERQRVMLARIFLKRPLLVLLDEATANLDVDNERAILMDLFTHIDQQASVVMVTHRAPAGIEFTRAYELSAGRLRPRSLASPERMAVAGGDLP